MPAPSTLVNMAASPFASSPAATPWPNLTRCGGRAPSGSRHRRPASTPAAAGPPNSRIQASATSGSAVEPGSHGLVADWASPSGSTANMTAPNSTPAPMPVTSVLRVRSARREVRNRVTPTYPMIISMTRISACQLGPPTDRPGTTPAQPWPPQKMLR
ncbi:MAG: hypothetical protein ABSB59_12415 [Streptosporangiaceae bacterium]